MNLEDMICIKIPDMHSQIIHDLILESNSNFIQHAGYPTDHRLLYLFDVKWYFSAWFEGDSNDNQSVYYYDQTAKFICFVFGLHVCNFSLIFLQTKMFLNVLVMY